MREAVLFLCHFKNEKMLNRYRKLAIDLPGVDVFWAFQTDNGNMDSFLHVEKDIRLFGFSLNDLNSLDYSPIFSRIVPGSLHFIIELFYNQHPEYNYYWMIEYDVVYTGNWHHLLSYFDFNDADLLASHISFRGDDNRDWLWWESLSCKNVIPKKMQVRAFTPIYRLSSCALSFLNEYLRFPDNYGHCEAILPTSLYNNGFRLEDFGGSGQFVRPDNYNKFYYQGADDKASSLRWRPEFRLEEIEKMDNAPKLYHPVKQ